MIIKKIPTNDFLMDRGISLAFCCLLCHVKYESFPHLIFECNFSKCLWRWLMTKFQLSNNLSTIVGWLDFCYRNKSPQMALVLSVAVINTLAKIQHSRNQAKHNRRTTSPINVIHWITSQVQMSDNSTIEYVSISILDLYFIKAFKVNIHSTKPPSIKEVIQTPPSVGKIKCNRDGTFIHDNSNVGGGEIFHNQKGDFLLAVAKNIHCISSIKAKFGVVIKAMEISIGRGWDKLWTEIDSSMVVKAFTNHSRASYFQEQIETLSHS